MSQVPLNVRLLEYTPNPDQVVATAARLCYSDADIDDLAQGVAKRDQAKFIAGLMASGHLSPIEHASFTFGIEGVSRSLLAQITRHRIASFSVKSQRYVGAIGKEDGFNYICPPAIKALGKEAEARFDEQMRTMQGWYDQWVEELGNKGEKSFEDARFVLPNAAETKMVVTMNARELMHFFSLRCCNRAQWEIRALAWKMLEEVLKVAPALFDKAGPGCLRGACPEGKRTCGLAEQVRQHRKELDDGE